MSAIDSLRLRAEWDRETTKRDSQIPFRAWHYADVEFPHADEDVEVPHPFGAQPDPDVIRYLPVAVSPAATIYRSADPDRARFTSTFVVLRSTVPCRARLLLVLESS